MGRQWAETEDLGHLRQLLHLDEADAKKIHDEVARAVYGKTVEETLEDLKLDDAEAAFPRRLRGELQLPERVADRPPATRKRRIRQPGRPTSPAQT